MSRGAARFVTLRDDGIHSGFFQDDSFVYGGGRADQKHAALFDCGDRFWRQRSERETERGCAGFEAPASCSEKRFGGAGGAVGAGRPSSAKYGATH